MKCSNCGHKIRRYDTICNSCGKPVNSGYFYDPYDPTKIVQSDSTMEFTFISPDEKVLGEFKPSPKVKSYLTKERIKVSLFQAVLLALPTGSALAIPGSFLTPAVYLPLIFYIAFITVFSVVPLYFYLRRLSRTVYIITDKRVVFTKPKGKALSKSIPVDSIEAAIGISNPISRMNYFSVFFPRKGHFDMNGIDTNLPVTVTLLSRIEKEDEKLDRGKPGVRHAVKSVRRISREIKERSFQYLDEVDALRAVKLFNNNLKEKKQETAP
jgi:hypothetical protein